MVSYVINEALFMMHPFSSGDAHFSATEYTVPPSHERQRCLHAILVMLLFVSGCLAQVGTNLRWSHKWVNPLNWNKRVQLVMLMLMFCLSGLYISINIHRNPSYKASLCQHAFLGHFREISTENQQINCALMDKRNAK